MSSASPGVAAHPDPATVETLQGLPLFADLAEDDLNHLADLARRISVPSNTVLIEEGTSGDQFFVILDGELEVTRQEGGRTKVLGVLGPGGFLSEMSLLEDRPRTASARTTRDSELLAVQPRGFRDLLARSPTAALAMLRTVTARLRSTESTLIEQGRMAGLGTLAAGLAHELNNPAAALVRSTDLLAEALSDWHRRCAELGHLSLSPQELHLVAEQEKVLLRRAAASEGITQRGRLGRLEAEIEERIEALGIEESWTLAPTLAEAGWEGRDIDDAAAELAPPHRGPFLRWVASGAVAFGLVNETRQAARAISDIVASVRSYSALDRGPVQTVDVRETLVSSLLILKRQLGEGIELVQDVPVDLPPIEGHGGELSQVWTNLIQNAVDAMNGSGTLEIHARPTGGGVEVQIVDSGPGIAPEVRPRIFDPFFTTKPSGKGTGLGLAISYGIVVNQHRGSIEVESRPGRTVFSVALPTRCETEREMSG